MFFPRIAAFLSLTVVASLAFAGNALANETLGDDAPRVRLTTSQGDMVIELAKDRAPITVENFLQYVDEGFYNGTIFHRVIEGFMIQGGGFNAAYDRKATRQAIPNEANNGLRNQRYSISMARTNAPHSATAQFFINSADNRNLDHTAPTARGWGYAVFGRVVEGQEVVDKISQVATGPAGLFSRDAPREQIVITEAKLIVPEPVAATLQLEAEASPELTKTVDNPKQVEAEQVKVDEAETTKAIAAQ